MDRPLKRPRLSFTHGSAEDLPEDLDLQTARARNDMRLKSIFEGIFEKYSKDFTEVGDEIDLQSGNLVVNNGHLVGMQAENDTGDKAQAWLFQTGLGEDPAVMDDEYDDGLEDGTYNELEHNPDAPLASNHHDYFRDNSDDRGSPDSLQDSALPYEDEDPKTDGPSLNARQIEQLPRKNAGPTDPLWMVPDIDAKFSTPTWNRHSHADTTARLPSNSLRLASPPDAGSLWAIPRRGRPRTDGKPKTTPRKPRPQPKPQHHSSPVRGDWPFANTADDSESDDPLQQCEVSPSPLKMMHIRGKRKTVASTDNHRDKHQMSTHMHSAAHGESSAASHKTPNQDSSKQPNVQRDMTFNNLSMPQSDSTGKPFPETLDKTDSTLPAETTPTQSYRSMTPDEARLIVRMRHIHRKRWKQIQECLPGLKLSQIHHWNALHWTDRRANPPPLTEPWSSTELETLTRLKDRLGLSWADIRAEFPSRLQAEIEFELLRLWVGDNVWNGGSTPSSFGLKPSSRKKQGTHNSPIPSVRRAKENGDRATPSLASTPVQREEQGPKTPISSMGRAKENGDTATVSSALIPDQQDEKGAGTTSSMGRAKENGDRPTASDIKPVQLKEKRSDMPTSSVRRVKENSETAASSDTRPVPREERGAKKPTPFVRRPKENSDRTTTSSDIKPIHQEEHGAEGASTADNNFVPCRKHSACTDCRRMKRKCDGKRPSCGTCSRLGRECTYDEVRKTTASSNMTPNQREEQSVKTLTSSVSRTKHPSTKDARVSPLPPHKEIQDEFEQHLDGDDMFLAGGYSPSPSMLSAIHLDSPAPSQKRSRSSSASPAKRPKLTSKLAL